MVSIRRLKVPGFFFCVWLTLMGIAYGDTIMVIEHKSGEKITLPVSTIDRVEYVKNGDATYYFTKGLNLHAEGKYREAIESFTSALVSEPKNADIFTARGRSYYMLKAYREALGDFDQAINLDDRNDWAYLMRGTVKKELGDMQGAEMDLKKALEIDPASRIARLTLSAIFLEGKRAFQAREIVSSLIDKDPLDREAREIRARAYLLTGDFSSAIKDLNELIKHHPSQAEYYALRGLAHLEMKEEKGAKEDLERARRLNPAHEEVKKLEARMAGLTSDSPASGRITGTSVASIRDFIGNNELNATAAAMEALKLLMGDLSPEEEKKFLAEWGPLFEFPTEESKEYMDQFVTLMEELHLLRGQIATAAYEFDAAWLESVMAVSYGSEKGAREALSIAERNKVLLEAFQAKLSRLQKKAIEIGNPPDAKKAKEEAKKKHKEALAVVKMVSPKPVPGEDRKKEAYLSSPIRREGEIEILSSHEGTLDIGMSVSFNAKIPPPIAAKAKKYRWVLNGYELSTKETPQIDWHFSTELLKTEKAEILLLAFDEKEKVLARGVIIFPVQQYRFQFEDWEGVKRELPLGERIHLEEKKQEEIGQKSRVVISADISIDVSSLSSSELYAKEIEEKIKSKYWQAKPFGVWVFSGQIGEQISESGGGIRLGFYAQGCLAPSPYSKRIVSEQWLHVIYGGRVELEDYARPDDMGEIKKTISDLNRELKKKIEKILSSLRFVPAQVSEMEGPEETVIAEPKEKIEERIAFHEANIRIIEANLAKDEEELAKEKDPARRAALEWRILDAKSDLQHEKDLIMSIKTGELVHTRTPFDDFARAQIMEKMKEEQRRMEEYTRTIAALNRLAGMLPEDEAEHAWVFIKRQIPFNIMNQMDRDKASKVAHALHEKVQGYYLKEGAQTEEAWANYGLETAQNIKAGADAGMFVISTFTGRGVMIAYQGVTGYIEGGPKEAALRAASWYSTPTYVVSEALRGYESGGIKGATEKSAIAFVSGKAFEYGASKLRNFIPKSSGKSASGDGAIKTVSASVKGEAKTSTQAVSEVLASEQFKAARAKGESVAREFAKAQAELQELGKKGAAAEEIIKKQAEVRRLVAEVNANPHAKNFLKYKGDALSQRAYNAHLRSVLAEVEAEFHEIMNRKGWNRQELKEFRNASSAGSVGMDYDIGLVEKPTWIVGEDGKLRLNKWLTKNGVPQTVDRWQKDAQEAWNESYRKVTGFSAEKSWETVTTSAHAESYRDLNLLSKDKNALKKIWAEQSADVTRYKMFHMLNDPHLTYMEKLQEISRGTAKDMETKLIPLLEKAKPKSEASAKALKESIAHWTKIKKVLTAFGNNTIDPVKANRLIRRHTGGKSIPEVVDDASVLLESLIKHAN